MSRLGKIPVKVPKEVKVTLDKYNVQMESSKGKITMPLQAGIKVEQKDDQLLVDRQSNTKQYKPNHGTVRANLFNMIEGLTKGHKKELEIQGIGFRAQLKGKQIGFNIGLSHPVDFDIPDD